MPSLLRRYPATDIQYTRGRREQPSAVVLSEAFLPPSVRIFSSLGRAAACRLKTASQPFTVARDFTKLVNYPNVWTAPSSAWIRCAVNVVSAGAKIPIVPVEFSPLLDVVNRSPLHTEEVPKLVKGERRARTKRTATAKNEHPGDQRADRLGPQDDSQVCAGGRVGTGVWPTHSTAEQA
jgi:hypothetical protein